MKRIDCREQLLNAGVSALHSKGFNGSGVQEITDAAGVPKGSFYNYFESKETFSAEVLDHYWEQRVKKNLAILSDESIPTVERLRTYFIQRGKVHEDAQFERGCMLGNLSTEVTGQSRLVRDRLAALFAGWVRVVTGCVLEGQRKGEIDSSVEAATIASFLINAWQGVVMRAKVERDSSSLDQFMEVVFSRVLAKSQESKPTAKHELQPAAS